MLTYRTGAAGAPSAARFMSEHLLQQTLPPEMSVMADYYEQGVAPPTVAEAAASRYAYAATTGPPLSGDRLDDIIRSESARLGESALRPDGSMLMADELALRSLAALTAAGLIGSGEALASFARLGGRPVDDDAFAQAVEVARAQRDYSSATATARRDMNPALAARLGIEQGRGLTQSEVAYLLNGQRADGGDIKGNGIQTATRPLREIFGLDAGGRPSCTQLANMLSRRRANGEILPDDEAARAVGRLAGALGATSKDMTEEQREHILHGRRADGAQLSDREWREAMETSKARIGYIDLTFSAPKSLSVAWAFAPTKAERAMLHQAHKDAIDGSVAKFVFVSLRERLVD
jgi:hypothetical protein